MPVRKSPGPISLIGLTAAAGCRRQAEPGFSAILFRKETFADSGHRNTFGKIRIPDNGDSPEGYGLYIEPEATGIVIPGDRIAETRSGEARTPRCGAYKLRGAGTVAMQDNSVMGHRQRDFHEASK